MNAVDVTGEDVGTARRLNFLIVSSDKFPPMRVDVTVLFGQEMVGRGHRIDWILQSEVVCDHAYVTKWQDCNVWVGSTDLGTSRLRRIRKHLLGFLHDLVMFKCMRNTKYDIVQVKDKFLIAPFAALLARFHGCRFTYWLSYPFPEASLYRAHDGTARYTILYLLRGWMLKLMLYRVIIPLADHVFVQSEQMKRDLIAEGVPSEKLTPVPMGIVWDVLPHMDDAAMPEAAHKELRIIYLGTLLKVRKLDFLVRVFAHVIELMPDTHLYMVGAGDDPSDEQILYDEAKRMGVDDKMTITGFLPQPEAWRYVATADVCVSPFYPTPILNSTSPTKLIEYMAMGKAVVANDHPEQQQVIAESGAGLCVPYDERAFAEAIVLLLNDHHGASDMGRRGQEYVKRERTYDRIALIAERQYLDLIRNAENECNDPYA